MRIVQKAVTGVSEVHMSISWHRFRVDPKLIWLVLIIGVAGCGYAPADGPPGPAPAPVSLKGAAVSYSMQPGTESTTDDMDESLDRAYNAFLPAKVGLGTYPNSFQAPAPSEFFGLLCDSFYLDSRASTRCFDRNVGVTQMVEAYIKRFRSDDRNADSAMKYVAVCAATTPTVLTGGLLLLGGLYSPTLQHFEVLSYSMAQFE